MVLLQDYVQGFATYFLFETQIYQEKLTVFFCNFHISFWKHGSENISRNTKNKVFLQLFYDRRPYRSESSPVMYKGNQWTGFTIMKEFRKTKFSSIICIYWYIWVRENIFYAAISFDFFTVTKEILKRKLVQQQCSATVSKEI